MICAYVGLISSSLCAVEGTRPLEDFLRGCFEDVRIGVLVFSLGVGALVAWGEKDVNGGL